MLTTIKTLGASLAILFAASAAHAGGCHGFGGYGPVYGGYAGPVYGGYYDGPIHAGYGCQHTVGYCHPMILEVCGEVGCSPRELYTKFQARPDLIQQFPDFAKLLEAQFGAFPKAAVTGVVQASATGVATGGVVTAQANGGQVAVGQGALGQGAAPVVGAQGAAVKTPVGTGTAVVTPNVAVNALSVTPVLPVGKVAQPTKPGEIPDDVGLLLGAWVNEDKALPVSNIDLVDGKATVTTQLPGGPKKETFPFRLDVPTTTLFITRNGKEEKFGTIEKADANRCQLVHADGTRFVFVRPAIPKVTQPDAGQPRDLPDAAAARDLPNATSTRDLPDDVGVLLGAWVNEDKAVPVSNIDLVDNNATITTQTADGPQKETIPFRLDVPTKTFFVTRSGQEVKFGTIVKADANRCELITADGTRFVFVRPAI